MEWTLDTGSLGAFGCTPSKLREMLEAELKHHANTAPETAARQVFLRYPPETRIDPSKQPEIVAAMTAAREKVLAQLPDAQAQMRRAIDAACALAESFECNVTVTIQGHEDKNHVSGVGCRLSVNIDEAPHSE